MNGGWIFFYFLFIYLFIFFFFLGGGGGGGCGRGRYGTNLSRHDPIRLKSGYWGVRVL